MIKELLGDGSVGDQYCEDLRKELASGFSERLIENPLESSQVAYTYGVRYKILQRTGFAHGGFEASLNALARIHGETVKLLVVDTSKNHWVCFIRSFDNSLLSCLFVERRDNVLNPLLE